MKKFLKKHGRFLLFLSIVVTCGYIISAFIMQLVLIDGNSMQPTYRNYELALVNKLEKNYQLGDVVVFKCEGLDRILIKRIAACPGDTLQIYDGKLFVNGNKSEVIPHETVITYSGIAKDEISLGKEEYFVIGDNIDQSRDSRYSDVGIINKSDFIGKLIPQKEFVAQ